MGAADVGNVAGALASRDLSIDMNEKYKMAERSDSSHIQYTIPGLYNIQFLLLGALWLYLVGGLMIADVWDETNFLVGVRSAPFSDLSPWEGAKYVWLNHISLYRPLPTSLLVVMDKLFELRFEHIRYANAILTLVSIYLLSQSLRKLFNTDALQTLSFCLLSLFSSSAFITAGWFANIFDASCLFFISAAVFLFSRERFIASAVVAGLSFFCKEIAILILPFAGMLLWRRKTDPRRIIAMGVIAAIFGGAYWCMRQQILSLGSDADIHGFSLHALLPSFSAFLKSFWLQHTKFSRYGAEAWLGLGVFFLSIFSIKSHVNKVCAASIILLSGAAYWSMFGHQEARIIDSLNFIGRLYLIPAVMLLFIMAMDAKKIIFLPVSILVFWGAIRTCNDHILFQNLYADMYKRAGESARTLVVHYPEKPLDDPSRNIRIGDFPDAEARIDPYRAELIVNP